MNPILLAGLIKNFYSDFNMNTFDNRLKIQKVVYLLKQKNMNLGYDFRLYLFGPYSSELTRDAFQMNDIIDNFSEIKTIVPSEKKDEFIEFIKIIDDEKKNNVIWLEVLSSFIFLKEIYPDKKDEDIFVMIRNKREEFNISSDDMKKIIDEVRKDGYFRI